METAPPDIYKYKNTTLRDQMRPTWHAQQGLTALDLFVVKAKSRGGEGGVITQERSRQASHNLDVYYSFPLHSMPSILSQYSKFVNAHNSAN